MALARLASPAGDPGRRPGIKGNTSSKAGTELQPPRPYGLWSWRDASTVVADDVGARARAAGTLLIARAIETGDGKPDPALCAEVHGAPDGYERFVASAAEAMVAARGAAATLGQLMAAVGAARPAADGEKPAEASARSNGSDVGPLQAVGESD